MPLPSLSGSGLVFTLWVSGKLSRQWALFETFCGTGRNLVNDGEDHRNPVFNKTFLLSSFQCRDNDVEAPEEGQTAEGRHEREYDDHNSHPEGDQQSDKITSTWGQWHLCEFLLVHLLESESENLFLTLLLCFIHVLLIFFSSIIFIYSWYSILQCSPWVAPNLSQSHLEKQASSEPPFPIKIKKGLITIIKEIFFFKKITSSKWKHPWVLGKQSDSIRWMARQRELKRKWEIEKIVKKEAGHHLEIPSPQIA